MVVGLGLSIPQWSLSLVEAAVVPPPSLLPADPALRSSRAILGTLSSSFLRYDAGHRQVPRQRELNLQQLCNLGLQIELQRALVQFAGVPISHGPDGLKALRWLDC
jgi:hypothetical protein